MPEQDLAPEAARAALKAAGRLLARRAFTETELRSRLLAKGFEEDDIELAVARLGSLELVDDGSFARDWIESRATRKGLGARRLRSELEAKGVADETIDRALEAGCGDELERAKALAASRISKISGSTPARQGARLYSWLIGRGFEEEVAEAAARAVLPPEGWD